MIDILAANAELTERQDRPAAESVKAARAGGAFALGTPRRFGGREADATTAARVLAELGRACPSTAWIAGTTMTSKTLAVRGSDLGEATLRELHADPDAVWCGSGSPSGQGVRTPEGVRVTGRWAYVSGCEDAGWAGFGALVDGAFSLVQIPRADLRIERTWDVAGMRGTGSHTVIAEDVLVPAERVGAFRLPPDLATLQVFGLTVLAPVVGATFGALDVVNAMFGSDRKPHMSAYAKMNESPGARHWLAEATTLAQRAERTMLAVAAEVDGGAELTPEDSSRLHLNLAEAGADCRAALDRMLDLHGLSGFATSNPLQRLWRDVSVGTRHPHLNGYLAMEGYGRVVSRFEA
jgi:alkylation response protein AidB-like acyl-CoA dehydrogenase